jgi:hypothetical protein
MTNQAIHPRESSPMSRIAPWLFSPLVVVAVACSGGDRLKPGSEAMLTAGEKAPSFGVLMKTEKGRGSIGGNMESVEPGARVRIVNDSGTDPPNDPHGRPIQIMILDGKHSGLPGTVSRINLKPLP